MLEKYAGASRPAAPPAEPLPPLSCDCHLHVFGDPAKFPDRNPNPIHASREASWQDALRMHETVGPHGPPQAGQRSPQSRPGPGARLAAAAEFLGPVVQWGAQSGEASGWRDVVPIGRALYAAAPDRCLFGTDWPHTHSHNEGGGPQESELIALLYRFLPDSAARQAVLVDNPARLNGFGRGA
jgi:Amidohydrolase